MIIMGREDVVGADAMQLSEVLGTYAGHKPKVNLSVLVRGSKSRSKCRNSLSGAVIFCGFSW